MRVLYHFPLCAFSRTVRIILAEKRLDFSLEYEQPWNISEELLTLDPIGIIPLFQDINGICVSGSSAVREYIEEIYPEPNIIGSSPEARAESRRIADCFSFAFFKDVYLDIITERILKRFSRNMTERIPDTAKMRSAMAKANTYIEYISWLVDRRNWLAGQYFSIADIYASSFISVLDYLGCINWSKHEIAKGWYVRIKSRPSFRSILKDNLSQIPPSKDYANLDF